jgi:hypothetical protein
MSLQRTWDVLSNAIEPRGWNAPHGREHQLRTRVVGDFKIIIGALFREDPLTEWGWYWEVRTQPSQDGWESSHVVSGGEFRDRGCLAFRSAARFVRKFADELLERMRVDVPGWSHGWDKSTTVVDAWSWTEGPQPRQLSFPHFRREKGFSVQFWRSMRNTDHWSLHRDEWGCEWSWTLTDRSHGVVVARGQLTTERSFDFAEAAQKVSHEVGRVTASLGVYR